MIPLKNKIIFAVLIITSQSHASNNQFASWLTFFKTKFTALKNYVSAFKTPHFNFKNWFFKRQHPTMPQQSTLPRKPIEKQLDIIDLTDMKFSKPEDPIDNDMNELRSLINETKIRPDQKKVLAHYISILDKKWKELATDFETLLSLNPDKSIAGKYLLRTFHHEEKEYLKKPYAHPEVLKEIAAYPLKQFAKKGIWLTDMIKPLNDETKNRFRNEGITDTYLDRIFIVIHTPDSEIPFDLLDEDWSNRHLSAFNSHNNIILISKELLDDPIAEQLFVLNHEIAHCAQRQVERRPYAKFMSYPFAEKYSFALKNFAKTFNEMEADILGILKLAEFHLINILPRFKSYDKEALEIPNNRYPSHRYDIALQVIKSLITGQAPKSIPDSWINYSSQELKNKIYEFQKIREAEKIKPQSKL